MLAPWAATGWMLRPCPVRLPGVTRKAYGVFPFLWPDAATALANRVMFDAALLPAPAW